MVTTREPAAPDDATPAATDDPTPDAPDHDASARSETPTERPPVVTVRSSRPARSWWWKWRRDVAPHPHVRRRVLALMFIAAVFAWASAWRLETLPARNDPAIALHAASHAIALVPATTFDLVRAARPRFGLHPDGSQYNGIRIDTAFAEIFLRGSAGPGSSLRLLNSLAVTSGCLLRIEHYVGTHIRLTVEQVPDQPCTMRAEFIRRDDTYDEVERSVDVTSAASLTFRPSFPLHLRDVAVTRLGFETNESGEWKSAIINARLELTGDGDAAVADLGDALALGALHGSVVELVVDDTMHVVYRGTAAHPSVAGVDMRPSRLAELASKEDLRRTLAIVLGLLGLLAGLFQAILK